MAVKREIIMKCTGITRPLDELGRVVLPMELRRTLNLNPKDSLEIFVDDDKIVLKKYVPSVSNVSEIANKLLKAVYDSGVQISTNTMAELNKLAKD